MASVAVVAVVVVVVAVVVWWQKVDMDHGTTIFCSCEDVDL